MFYFILRDHLHFAVRRFVHIKCIITYHFFGSNWVEFEIVHWLSSILCKPFHYRLLLKQIKLNLQEQFLHLLPTARKGNVFKGVCHSVHWGGGLPRVPTSSGSHCSGRYASYWNAFLLYIRCDQLMPWYFIHNGVWTKCKKYATSFSR